MKKLLLIIDYQKDFVDGTLGFPGAEMLDGPIAQKIAAYRASGDDIAFTLDTHGEDYLLTQEGRKLPVAPAGRSTGKWAGPVSRRIPSSKSPPFPLRNWASGFKAEDMNR